MIISNIPGLSSTSTVKAKVDLYNGSTLVKTCTCGEVLSDFKVTREGDNSKFFGFGICHKLDVNLIDLKKELLAVTIGNTAEIGLGDGVSWDAPYPTFYITELKRDEKTNTVTGTAYDKLYTASEYLFDDLGLTPPYTLEQVAQAIANKLGLTLNIATNIYSAFRLIYPTGGNFNETNEDNLRTALNWLAEATQSIYYINSLNELVFKQLDKTGDPVIHITKNDYYELATKTPKTLTGISNVTELGDNLEATIEGEGVTQYIRNNPFLELREDLPSLLDSAIATLGGLTIAQFDCDWVGNYLLEIGDKLALTTEDNSEVYSYLISDVVSYGGTLNEVTEWEYSEERSSINTNPTTIGEKITQTFAKVDKVNKRIELLVSDVSETKESVASLTMTTDAINLKVTEHEKKIDAFEELETGQITDRMAQIELELDNITATVSENTSKVESIEADNEEINTELTALKAADVILDEKLTSNTNRLSSVEVELGSVKTTVINQNTQISNLYSADEAIRGSIQLNSNAIGELEVTTEAITASVNQANSKITTLTNTTSGLTTTTEAHTEQIGALEVSTSKISASVSSNTAQIQSTANEVAGVKQTASSNTTKIGTIEASLDGINLTVSNQSSKINALETTTQNQGTEIDNLAETVEETATNIVTLTETTEEHTSKISQIETDLDSIDLSVKNQTSKITTLETKTTQQDTAINELTEDVEENTSNISTLTETTEEHTSQIAQLQIDTNSITASVSANTSQINTISTGLDALADTTETHATQISALQIESDEISATVTNITETSKISTENLELQIEQLTQEVSTKVTTEDLNITIRNELSNGVSKVETTTGYTFDNVGLTIEKSGREMKTQITEDGMTVYRDDTAVLTADNTGVDAKNLKASTYLVIGTNSRFENYGTTRTACFWIGD